MILFLLLITLFEGMFNVVVVFVIFRKSNCGCCGCCCSNIMVIILLTFCFDRSFMIEPSVKKAVAQRGWIPLNMNCLYHPDIITTKVTEDNQRKEDLERNVLRNNMGVAIDLTEADVQAATDGPGAIQEFNWKGNITRQVFENCNTRLERYKAQEVELERRGVERLEQGAQQLDLFSKLSSTKLSSGLLYFNGVASPNNPQTSLISHHQQDKMRQKMDTRALPLGVLILLIPSIREL